MRSRQRFDKEERTVHKDIAPAKDRVVGYKTKCFGRLFSGIVEARNKTVGEEEVRPATSPTSHFQAELTTQAQSVFEEEEGSKYSLPFQRFYTNDEQPVVFKTQNRFEGRSNYQNYYPTDDMTEQKIEKMWYHYQNKQLADKRRDEELKLTLKEWSDARARVETELQRKGEHQTSATRFVESRAFVRSNWKSKKFDPTKNPLEESSSSEEEIEGATEIKPKGPFGGRNISNLAGKSSANQ